MTELIDRIQNWYKLHCNGEWEHSYGYSIGTLDNPGWTIRIDLAETSLEKLEFSREYQNPVKPLDWYFIKTEDKTIEISCGPDNLKKVLSIFLDEIIPRYSDKEFKYQLYLPLSGYHLEIWIPVLAKIHSESSVEITVIPEIEYHKIKVRNIENIDFSQDDLENLRLDYKVRDIVEIDLHQVFSGVILTTKNTA